MKTVILLTGCINPDGMKFTSLNDTEERGRQYIQAIRYYLTSTNYPVIFCENSGTDISTHFLEPISTNRLECITYQGNQEKTRGKGYGECDIIEYAIKHSQFIHSQANLRIAKITGRLIVQNIRTILSLHQAFSSKHTTFCMINSDLSFPDSRLILAHIDFYKAFLSYKEKIDDANGYFFEHALCDMIKSNRTFPFSPFFICPQVIGISGSSGKAYITEPSSISFKLKYARYAASQLYRFNKQYR